MNILINNGRTVEDIAREHFTGLHVERRISEQKRRKAQIRKEKGITDKLDLKNPQDVFKNYLEAKDLQGKDEFEKKYGGHNSASAA